ncbi:hypothetical protein QBC34DRAFT_492073 [Podospora aff. communis PSN243]|uniref:Aminoglycoside phosphotransferase domain-containing protein n=1 Tax=Podospora aff. communis PSN243 TaxID=3040156 RepID=A0AAV9GXM6_9PEZI|nr:hypothetical protein QBC34DRAFT_492073 [Podospora aff. communis PSN243]
MSPSFCPPFPPPSEDQTDKGYRSDDDTASVTSCTSTVEWDQEPYETFQHKVLACAKQVLWPATDPADVVATRMTGGGYNRIIGLSIRNRKGRQTKRRVIRVPRFDETANVAKDVAALQFVKQRTSIPVPRVVGFSATHDNELGLPCMIQTRLKGEKALHVYGNYNHQARCTFAVELGGVFRQILATQSPIPGVPVFAQTGGDNPPPLGTEVQIAPFPEAGPQHGISFEDCSTREPMSVLQFIETMIEHRKQVDHSDTQDPWFEFDLLDSLLGVAREMSKHGYFDKVPHTLVHQDLQIYSIMASDAPFPGDSALTAIIDWDEACLAPAFMTCIPPQWLWGWDEELDELDETKADDTPEDVENREIKRLFEEAAGPLYERFAYDPVYRVARIVTKYCFTPLGHNAHAEEIDAAVDEWKSIKAGLGV